MNQYGIFLGRFSPLHNGHNYTIDHIIADGLTPVIIIGSAQDEGSAKNPYTTRQRMDMIHLKYPDMRVLLLEDQLNWDNWHDSLVFTLQSKLNTTCLSSITIYTHNKEQDRLDFTFRGIDYTNEFYSKMYEVDGMQVKNLPQSGIDIHATDIRADLDGNKHNLHPKVYNYLQGTPCN